MISMITEIVVLLLFFIKITNADIGFTESKQNKIVGFWAINTNIEDYSSYITEQLYVLQTSGLMKAIDHLYYITNGNEDSELSLLNDKMSHLLHYNAAEETTSLYQISKFCKNNTNSKVFYFHNLHDNVNFRRSLDCYVLNPNCISTLDKHDTCGWRFSPSPYMHYTGNYWWATCKHINKLINPLSYTHNQTFATETHIAIEPSYNYLRKVRIREDRSKFQKKTNTNNNNNNNNNKFPHTSTRQLQQLQQQQQQRSKAQDRLGLHDYPKLGLGKYFADSWIGSFPVYSPADCMSTKVDTRYIGGANIPWFAVAPYCPNFKENFKETINEWSKLASTISETPSIPLSYGLSCSNASVLFDPGAYVSAVLDKNSQAKYLFDLKHVDRLTKRSIAWYGQAPVLQLEWIAKYGIKTQDTRNKYVVHHANAHVVAFYNIYAAGPVYKDIVREQTFTIKSSGLLHELDAIYYTTIGSEGANFRIPGEKYKHLTYFGLQADEMHTIDKIKEYCALYPVDKILYFHNKGSFNNHISNVYFRKSLDCFNLNPYCLEVLGEYDTCGWRLSPLPHLHYSGNYWWATCKHINKLIDPLAPIRNQTFTRVTSVINPHRKNDKDYKFYDYPNLGLGRFFAETWIGSLPNFYAADCMNASVEQSYTGGYAIPYYTVIDKCPNFKESFAKLVASYDAYAIGYDNISLVPSITYGLPCSAAHLINEPEQFTEAINHELNMFKFVDKYLKKLITRSILWYGEPPISQLAWLKKINIFPS